MSKLVTLAIRTLCVLLALVLAMGIVQPRGTSAATTLGISKTVVDANTGSSTTANVGDTLTYRLSLTNTATSTAFPVTVTDVLQPGQTYVAGSCLIGAGVTSSTASCGPISGGIGFQNLSVPAGYLGGTPDLTFQVTVNPGTAGPITNQATALGAGQTALSNTTSINVGAAAATTLTASKTVENVTTGGTPGATATASPGNTLRYFLNFANTGSTPAAVTLTDTLQSGQNFLGCAPSPCSYSGGTVTFGPYTVAGGSGGQATLDVQVSPTFNGTLSNTFSASAPGATTVTSAATSTFVSGTAISGSGLGLEKQVRNMSTGAPENSGIIASPGNTVRYFLLVGANALQQSATGVVITDTLQAGQTFANNCSVPCTFDGVNTVRLTVGGLAPGTQQLVTFDATINSNTCGQIITNTAGAAGTNTNAATSNGTSIVVTGSCAPAPVTLPVVCPTACAPQPPTTCPNACAYYAPSYYYGGYGACGYGCVGTAYARTVTVCGVVQTYQAAVGATPGYMTVNGEAFILMPYMAASGSAISVGTSYCFTLTINGYCQITSMVVAPNVATASYVCGIVTPYTNGYAPWGPYMPYPAYSPYPGYSPSYTATANYGPYGMSGPYQGYYGFMGPMIVGGYPYPVSQNVAFPFSLSYGSPYCFLQNNVGVITGSLSVVPTSAATVESPTGTRHVHTAGSV